MINRIIRIQIVAVMTPCTCYAVRPLEELQRDLDDDNRRQYIRVDRVNYDDEDGRPAEADGGISSVSRQGPRQLNTEKHCIMANACIDPTSPQMHENMITGLYAASEP